MKGKRLTALALLLILALSLALPAAAAEPAYAMSLTVNGKNEAHVLPGNTVTLVFTLQRTDEESGSTIYGVQNELCYDPDFFELIEGSAVLTPGVESAAVTRIDGRKALYMSYLSLGSGTLWSPRTDLGSVSLRVIGKSGGSTVSCANAKVCRMDGSGSFPLVCRELTVIVGGKVPVHYALSGGTGTEESYAELGEPLAEPEAPEKEGFRFLGWFRDEGCSELWDFEKDTVQSEMTLYAGWEENSFPFWVLWLLPLLLLLVLALLLLLRRKTVHFETNGATELPDVRVWKGGTVAEPVRPERLGHIFLGWYGDASLTERWDFGTDTVKHDTTLYARWS